MDKIWENLTAILPFFVFSWALFLFFTIRRPQRFRNSFLLLLAIGSTLFLLCGLFGVYSATAMLVCFALVFLAILYVPVMLIANGITMLRREGRSAANILSLVLGLIVFAGELSFSIVAFTDIGILERGQAFPVLLLLAATVFYFSFWILAFVLYILVIQILPHRMKFDYVIIHGCGLLDGSRVSTLLANRLDRAIEVYKRCRKKPMLLPSGGRGGDETLSEAEAMHSYLLAHGIPENRILTEGSSMTTMENLRNSFEIISLREGSKRTALVSSNYHVYRCLLYASSLRFPCVGIGAKVAWYYWPSATLREFAAVFTRRPHVLWLLAGYVVLVAVPILIVFF